MRGSHTKTMPQSLEDWLALVSADWSPSYPFPGDIRQAVVEALYQAQRGLCVYCGRRLDMRQPGKSYHIAHFRPQADYPDLSTDLANLFLSCGQETREGNLSETYGTAKGNRFDENRHIEPDYPVCMDKFRFRLSGEIAPQTVGDRAAEVMVVLLNLNHRELKKDREDLLDRIDGGSLDISDFIDASGRAAQSYAHVVCRHLGATIP